MIALISCGKAKLDHAAPAREMYTGNLFRAAFADCRQRDLPIFIVSARHGLVGMNEIIRPYDLKLTDMPMDDRRRWAWRIAEHLRNLYMPTTVDDIELHAGQAYADPLIDALIGLRHPPKITQPCQGMQIGERLHYYKERRT